MIQIFKTIDSIVNAISVPVNGSWINLVSPTEYEVSKAAEFTGIDIDLLLAATDEEERARIEFFDDAPSLILVDMPVAIDPTKDEEDGFETIPFGIILAKDAIVTVCTKNTIIQESFINNSIKNFSTGKRARFVLQMLYKIASLYLIYLKQIEKRQKLIEKELRRTMKNKELILLLGIEKSLVYFSTSLKSNELVLEKLFRHPFIKTHSDDQELLDDTIIENKQAIETVRIYSEILSSTMDAYSSVISNSMNLTMKKLTSITIVMSLPMIISGLWGMNVPVPLATHPYGFLAIAGGTVVLCIILYIIMRDKKMF